MKIVLTTTDTRIHVFDIVAIEGAETVRFPRDMLNNRIIPPGELVLDLPIMEGAEVRMLTDKSGAVSYRIS